MRYLPITFGAVAACFVSGPASAAEQLGTVRVESSTISDRFADKRTEPSNTALIAEEEVERAHARNIQQLLEGVPGVTTELQSGDSLKIHIRGVENQRFMGEKPGVAVVIDGVPVFERTGRVNIDLDNIESIKVVKGGASYLFGEDALAGAVIITTKRGADMAGYRLLGEVGSFGYNKGLVRAGFAGENAAGHIQISRREADGYYFQSDYKADYLNGKLQYYLSDTSDVTFGFERSDREKDSHGAVEGITQAEEDPRSVGGRDYARMFDVDLGKYFVTYSNDLSASDTLSLNVYQFTDNTDFVSAPRNYDADGNPVDGVDDYTTANGYEQVQRGVKSEWRSSGDRLAWMAGVDLRNNTYENTERYIVDFKRSAYSRTVYTAGTVTADNTTDEIVRAAYAETKLRPADSLVVTLNGRYDLIELDYSDHLNALDKSREFRVPSWRAGLNWAVASNFDIYANGSTGFRTPTVTQLFAGDISPFGDTASNPDLDPEQSLNLELGFRGRADWGVPVDYDLAVFQLDRKDFIMAKSGNYAVPESGTLDQYQNIGGVRNRGVELSLESDRRRELFFDVAYTYLDARYTDYEQYNLVLGNRYVNPTVEVYSDLSGNIVPRVPKHHLNVGIGTHVSPAMTLRAETDTISSYFADDLNRLEIAGHTALNLLANYDTKLSSGDRMSLFARVDNVLEREYFNTARAVGDRNEDGVFDEEDLSLVVNPGRTFTVGLSVQF
jgi:iron complex outermembrane receptor protein